MTSWKFFISVFLFLFLFTNLYSQNKLRNEFYIGLANSKIIFEKDTSNIVLLNKNDSAISYTYSSNSNICDTNGQLILATSSYSLYGKIGNEFTNGNQINTDSFNWYNGLSVYANNSIFLPKGNNTYYLFQQLLKQY